MFGSQILDIALGTVFVFFLFSLISSGLNELILSTLKYRAKDLARGLRELLNEKEGKGLMEEIFNHGMIYCLFQGEYRSDRAGNLPSYIPPRSFAIALKDVLLRNAQWNCSPPSFDAGNSLDAFRDAVLQLPNARLREPLLSAIDLAKGDFDLALHNIEDWYNSTMERVSGWYKRRTQWVLIALGLSVAVAFNVDTIALVRQLSSDMALRQSLVAAAEARAKQPQPASDMQGIQGDIDAVQGLGLPVGWLTAELATDADPSRLLPATGEAAFALLRAHICGWILTAVAISMGAPFWFDVLNKIVVVRSTIKPREKSQEEKSKE